MHSALISLALPAAANQSPANRSVSRIIFTDDGASSYHGQTSALFEENVLDRSRSKPDAIPTEWVEKGLVAEASLQRRFGLVRMRVIR